MAPPLPAPNNDRQAARAGGVVFQRAPPAVHLNRDSQLSDDHIYQDIEDDEDTRRQSVCCLSACLPACLPVCLSACLSACLPVCLSVCLSVCQCVIINACVMRRIPL